MSIVAMIILYTVLLVALFLPIWFTNSKKKKKFNQMMSELKVGDKIETIGGIQGEVSKIEETTVKIQISKGVSMTITKGAIARVVK